VAPSIHPTGQRYIWTEEDEPIADAPPALMKLISEKPLKSQEPPQKKRQRLPWEKPEDEPEQKPIIPKIPDNDITDRARLYLAKCEPAVQGQAGHDKLLWAASALVHGYLLDDSTALSLLWNEYNPKCVPPWNAGDPADVKDFERKVPEGCQARNRMVGY